MYIIQFLVAAIFLYFQGQVNFQFTSRNLIDFIVTDPQGNKTGKDPRGSGIKFNDIPGSSYGITSYGDEEFIAEFIYKHISPQDDGTYTIDFIGKGLGQFEYFVYALPEDATAQQVKRSIKTYIDSNTVMTYQFTYYGNPVTPAKVEKVINIYSLGQDIATGGKLNLVGNQAFIKNLLSHCDQMAKLYNAGKKAEADNTLKEIKKSIQDVTSTPGEKIFVKEYAYKVLLEDIDLTAHLIGYTYSSETPLKK